MIISDILAARQFNPLQQQRLNASNDVAGNAVPQNPNDDGTTFAATLREFIGDVNDSQHKSAEATEKLIKGEPVDIHDVMISAEKAKTSFQLLLELRNKALDLYREAIRIQV
ncbi:hypothetical protein MASR2M18_06380 [Ignavibacteria bacterium]|nr:flagellar hook-basal body complex protein FliE [Bacteroidota bacterium]MCZ2132504.1 flagellar hook-basal body complex protein FliE [Bacteroidota bacterium]